MSRAMASEAGLRFVVERIGDGARALLARHLLALPPQDRYLRFGSPVSSPRIVAYVDGIDFARDAVLAVHEAETLELTGVVHAAFDGDEAELGVSVLPEHRNRGIGRMLLEGAVAQARNRGMRRLWMHFLPHNAPIVRLARKLGMRIASRGPQSCARLDLAAAVTNETNPPAVEIGPPYPLPRLGVMDNEIGYLPAEAAKASGNPRAFAGNAMPAEDPASRIDTHWSRILYVDLFAPARRGSPGETK